MMRESSYGGGLGGAAEAIVAAGIANDLDKAAEDAIAADLLLVGAVAVGVAGGRSHSGGREGEDGGSDKLHVGRVRVALSRKLVVKVVGR